MTGKPQNLKPNIAPRLTLVAYILVFILSACTGAEESATTVFTPVNRAPMVSASGEVVPELQALLSLSVGGVIADVHVKKGEMVSDGQILVQLEGSEKQLAAISAAELELLNAQFALEALYEETDLLAAQALQSAEATERALEDLNNPEFQQALALKAVAVAQKTFEDTQRNLAIENKTPTQDVIDQAYANMLLAENKLNDTLDLIEDTEYQLKKYAKFSSIAGQLREALKGLEIQRTQEQLAYNNSQTRYNNLLSPPDPIDVEVAETGHASAEAQLIEAKKDLQRLLDGPDAGEIALLEAQIEIGYRDYETYSAGPDPGDVVLAEARIANAEAQLAAAKATLADLELVAPFDGVISELHTNPSEWVAPGSPVLLIANLDHLRVETTDLSEIDVAQIVVGDTAIVTFDALPDLVLGGTITRIAPKASTSSGVNFPVIIELSEIPPELRWGMTAFVDIELE